MEQKNNLRQNLLMIDHTNTILQRIQKKMSTFVTLDYRFPHGRQSCPQISSSGSPVSMTSAPQLLESKQEKHFPSKTTGVIGVVDSRGLYQHEKLQDQLASGRAAERKNQKEKAEMSQLRYWLQLRDQCARKLKLSKQEFESQVHMRIASWQANFNISKLTPLQQEILQLESHNSLLAKRLDLLRANKSQPQLQPTLLPTPVKPVPIVSTIPEHNLKTLKRKSKTQHGKGGMSRKEYLEMIERLRKKARKLGTRVEERIELIKKGKKFQK